ncbi:DUF982 domain-containing protein [Devosia ginsengisoli]|uniref:DUF982 domain-containing protein n=2 Tax=Devosia ginsengisoli TaxID=400770 RepID=A0A5B8LRY9_9HYPH|nr:DUF982 domain-containing protein [Devosia ginsengisoli]
MGIKPFMRPIFLRMDASPSGKYEVRNVAEAIQYLEYFWSAPRTVDYRRAKAICRSALDNLVSAESARHYLIAAAERAGILDRSANLAVALSVPTPAWRHAPHHAATHDPSSQRI